MQRWALVVRRSGASPVPGIARALAERGVAAAGFAQEPIEVDGARQGYEILRVGHDDRRNVGRRGGAPTIPSECSFCSMVFDEDAFAAARGWVREDAARADVVLLDALSKLEAAGRGHADAVREALESPALAVLCVRAEQLFPIMERFGLDEPIATLDAADEPGPTSAGAFAESVAAAVAPSSAGG